MKRHIYLTKLSYLPEIFTNYIKHNKVGAMVDFGCAYGFWFNILAHHNLLPETAVGIEQDKELCEYMLQHIQKVHAVVGNVTELKFPQSHFDLAVCNQTIEHTTNDEKVISNIYDSLQKGGVLYISSIIRKEPAWYPYRYEGEIRLSPKHVKEYRNLQEFTSLLTRNGFKILQARDEQYWLRSWSIPGLRGKIAVPIWHFRRCEALCVKL